MGDWDAHSRVTKKAIAHEISLDGTGGYTRHLLLCVSKSCCGGKEERDTARRMNKRMSRLKKEGVFVYHSEVDCLDLCRSGPLLVVYPDGTWYHSVTPKVLDRIIDEHILGGKVVEEFAFACNPMRPAPAAPEAGPPPADAPGPA